MDPGVKDSSAAPAQRLTLAAMLQFLGASSIVAILTWSLTNFINHKNNQQSQLNSFIGIISDLMINKGLDSPGSQPLMPPVSRAAHGFVLNTLETLDGAWPIGDLDKKQELLKFLYDSRMIGFCDLPTVGAHDLQRKASLAKCVAPRVDLRDAKLMGLDFAPIGTKLMGIDLSQAKLQKSNPNTVDLRFANFAKADLTAVNLGRAMLNSSDLSQASLIGANLAGATISRADLSGSQLCGANLQEVTGLETVDLQGATFDKSTKVTLAQLALLVQRGARIQPCRSKTA